jgi:catechol 2,3-dioxygenase-like lactoylglutathione lyase family enzyme
LAKLEADGFAIQRVAISDPGILAATLVAPAGDRLEFFDQRSSNLSFTADTGVTAPATQRSATQQTVPILAHHIHLYVPKGAESAAKAWYVKTFGGQPGKRWQYDAVDLPGINLNFSGSATRLSSTKGQVIDHIGFEVVNLQQFCKKLQDGGVKLDVPYTVQRGGFASAYLTDPWGTYIELTEGLNNVRVP